MEELDPDRADPGLRVLEVGADEAGARLDKVLAGKLGDLSRAGVQRLIGQGLVSLDGEAQRDASAKAQAGLYRLVIPPPQPAAPQPEAIVLDVLFEDEHLIVIDKPAGLAAHPAPGSPTGTLVNALLRHCGDSLSGIGGVARPGIVHRLDKLTSGVMVAAKTDAAHLGLSKLFAAHDIERSYIALTRGAPKSRKGRIETQIGRSSADRQKMAVLRSGGRLAITDYAVEQSYGPAEKPLAARVRCRLETGRTHQIRVHLASIGAPVLGDPLYGAGAPSTGVKAAIAACGLRRQALHAAVLGFVHPITGETMHFKTDLPADMAALQATLELLP